MPNTTLLAKGDSFDFYGKKARWQSLDLVQAHMNLLLKVLTRNFHSGTKYWKRVIEHWHTGSMTRRIPVLHQAVPNAYVELHPDRC